ncbi:MAG: transcriptional repressor, partial [Bifidobacterium boum]|nr:transcriptional repressor [Bifidobacterium boum]
NSLAESGAVDTVRLDGQQMFRICDDDSHHHHLICSGCGKTIEIEPPDMEWMRQIARSHGFKINSHTLEIFGLCSDCQHKRAAQPTRNSTPERR